MSTPDYRDLLDRNSGQDERVLNLLFESYNERIGFDNAEIRQAFEDLYAAMNGKPLRIPQRRFYVYQAVDFCVAALRFLFFCDIMTKKIGSDSDGPNYLP